MIRFQMFIPQEMCKKAEGAAFELGASINCEKYRSPRASGPIAEESTDDCLRIAVRDGDKFGPASKTVDTGKMESLNVGGD